MKRRTVLSLEQALSMPYATLRFAQLGWRVIRIEALGAGKGLPGDPNRYIGKRVADDDRRSYYIAPNVGKEAIALNLKTVEGREAIRFDGRPLAVARLGRLLGFPERDEQRQPGSQFPCVVVRSGEERVALLVEEILGDREVLVKELRPPLVRVRNVAGAGLLGTGRLVLILRPADLLKSARESPRSAVAPAASPHEERQKTILVVDDSITTRTMEKNLLEAAGYQVRVAVDGIDAWTLLKSEAFDLVVSDVDMPRMNGFDLTARIRADRALADLPVVLVTALESREDKERGVEVGANAYIIKSSFDQSNLLEIIRRRM